MCSTFGDTKKEQRELFCLTHKYGLMGNAPKTENEIGILLNIKISEVSKYLNHARIRIRRLYNKDNDWNFKR